MSNPHDDVTPQKAQRHGGQKGARVYVPQAALKQAFTRQRPVGLRSGEFPIVYEIPDTLYYTVHPWGKKTVLIRFGGEGEL